MNVTASSLILPFRDGAFLFCFCSKNEQPSPRKSSKRCIMEEKIAALRAELEAAPCSSAQQR